MPSNVIEITSIDDPRVEVFRDVRDRDLRGRDGIFMAESEHVVRRLLKSPLGVYSLLLSPIRYESLRAELDEAANDAPVYIASVEMMERITGFPIHRGALAAGIRPDADDLSLTQALGHLRHAQRFTLIIAEGLTNVDNMGALFRNAAAFGADGVLLDPSCCDPLYRKAIRVSMGHVLSVPYAVSEHWIDDLSALKRWRMTIAAAESNAHAVPLWQLPPVERLALMFGSEGHGLSGDALSFCDGVFEIPMAGEVPSLNVAVATAAFLYERTRPRSDAS